MYLELIAAKIRSHIPDDRLPDENVELLLLLYSVLLRAKGIEVSDSDVHDAWSIWKSRSDPEHKSLIPFDKLPQETREQDAVFTIAIRKAAAELAGLEVSQSSFEHTLFPSGLPVDEAAKQQVIDLYKLMVSSSESLVGRRQGVNTFFLTINGALLTAFGLLVKTGGVEQLTALGTLVLAVAGLVLCAAWRSLIESFGQLNGGKFRVINTIEKYLGAAIYAAEWEALEHGKNPNVYRSFTSREVWVPNALLVIYGLVAVGSMTIMFEWIEFIMTWFNSGTVRNN